MIRVLLGLGAAAIAAVQPVHATAAQFDRDTALALSRAAIGRQIRDFTLYDRAGRPVRRADVAGRPLVLSLVYTSCVHSCTVSTRNLDRVVEMARDALGEESFAVATVGFDAGADTPPRMASYARGQGVTDPRWRFLSGDAPTLARLAEDVGFSYVASPQGFDHIAQTTLIDADGRVVQQVYGDAFVPPALIDPLKALLLGRPAPTGAGWLEGVRLLCTVYDPAAGRYRLDYSIVVAIGVGVTCLGSVGVFLVRAWREHSAPRGSVPEP